MPQPLKKRPEDLSTTVRGSGTTANLMSLVVKVINTWADIENNLCVILAFMLRIESTMAADLYFSTASLPMRLDMLRAVARTTLNETLRAKLSATLDNVRKASRKRNTVVHAQWYFSKDHPDHLIRVDNRDAMAQLTESFMTRRGLMERGEEPTHQPLTDMADGFSKYDQGDLVDIVASLQDMRVEVNLLFADLIHERNKLLSQ